MPAEHSISKLGALARRAEQLDAVDVDLALGRLDRLAAVRPLVEALAADLDRRGHRHAAARSRPVGSSSRSGIRPVSVSSPSGSPVVERQPSRAVATVGLRQREQEALQPGRPARAGRAAARWRTGRACRRGPTLPPRSRRDLGDHVVRGDARRLVDQQDPGRRSASRSRPRSAASWARDLAAAGTRPARRSCEVGREAGGPPVAAAARARGRSPRRRPPSVERRLTLRAARPPSGWSRMSAATAVPSSARRWSMMPSVSTSLGARSPRSPRRRCR